MKLHKIYIQLFVVTFLFYGCKSLYIPTTPNVPLFEGRNEFRLESTVFTNGVNLKTAYTPIKHIAFQMNGQYSHGLFSNSKPHKYLEGAVGVYFDLNESYLIEFNGGYGKGMSGFSDPFSGNYYSLIIASGQYQKTYLQVNIGEKFEDNEDQFGGSLRVGNVKYTYDNANYSWLVGNTYNHLCIEPYFFMNSNFNTTLSLNLYAGLTLMQNGSQSARPTIRAGLLNGGIGLRINIR